MYEKSRLQGGTKSVDVEDEREEVGMRSLNSLEDATKRGAGDAIHSCWMGESPTLCGDAIHSSAGRVGLPHRLW